MRAARDDSCTGGFGNDDAVSYLRDATKIRA